MQARPRPRVPNLVLSRKGSLVPALHGGIIRYNQNRVTPRSATQSRILWLIAAFKLFKGLALLALGVATLKLLHKDVIYEVERWADLFRVDPGNFYVHKALARLSILDDRKLEELSVGTFFYSALLLTEGTGLFLQKRWAEYFTIIVTSSFIPLEIYEIVKRATAGKVILLLINLAVVAYLVVEVRQNPEIE
jgi:uncharacterized membrane protein (DUF2068 family)